MVGLGVLAQDPQHPLADVLRQLGVVAADDRQAVARGEVQPGDAHVPRRGYVDQVKLVVARVGQHIVVKRDSVEGEAGVVLDGHARPHAVDAHAAAVLGVRRLGADREHVQLVVARDAPVGQPAERLADPADLVVGVGEQRDSRLRHRPPRLARPARRRAPHAPRGPGGAGARTR